MNTLAPNPDGGAAERASCHDGALTAGRKVAARREFLNQRYVYWVISQRAGGMSIGVNMNPNQLCNFDCLYCEVDRSRKHRSSGHVNLEIMFEELQKTLRLVHTGALRELGCHDVPPDLLELKEVALSGDGEPTLCPNFSGVVEVIANLRELEIFPHFKLVLITNGSGLHTPEVRSGLARMERHDEVWAKLDAGTQEYMDLVNQPEVGLEFILNNILQLAKRRPVIIQSLFAEINGTPPPDKEIEEYAQRLLELKQAGANIPLVQIYSAHRPAVREDVAHLPLRTLSAIAKRVREVTGLRTEVF